MEKSELAEIAREWPPEFTLQALNFVWQGYDLLTKNILSQVDIKNNNAQIELSITSYLEPNIRDVMTGDEAFYVQHGVPEFETRYSDQAQPPSYDIAFVLRANGRIRLPLEAKVLKKENDVSEYVKEINFNFLTCRYAPFSSAGGMLGYLIQGNPDKAFKNIEIKTPCTLSDHPDFPVRHHKTSDHKRTVPQGKPFPSNFCCHHLILEISIQSDKNQ